ncbi:MAG: TonB-dependent receptor [Novosphingobium sp.]|nr:TonB-dependent receptor [Novosphingobium sp.]
MLPASWSVPAAAQSETVASRGDIVVTARKREESILKVPVVVTAVSGEMLDTLQVTEVTDLPRLVPSLLLGSNLLSIGPQVTLRGIGTSSSDPGVDQSVSLNLDGMSLGNGLAFASGMFDVGQVEVLKGPQALFYGKSSPGGVISIRTADPTDEFEVMARAGYEFDSRAKRGELIVSGPVSETLGARFATTYSKADGYFINNAVPIPGTGGQLGERREGQPREFIARGTLKWEPDSRFSARLKFTHAYNKSIHPEHPQHKYCPNEGEAFGFGSGVPGSGIPAAPNFLTPVDPVPFIVFPCKLDRYTPSVYPDPDSFAWITLPNGGKPFVRTNQNYGTLELNYDLSPELGLTSTTGYYHLKSASLFGRTEGTGPLFTVTNAYSRREFTQELRLNSDYSGPLNFTLGAFYQDGRIFDRVAFQRNLTFGFIPATILNTDSSTTVDIETYSLFGQLRYKLTDQLELAGGVRWTDESRSERVYDFRNDVDITATLPNPSISSSNFSPEATITFTPTDDLTLFASAKQGYKSGSFKIAVPAVPGEDNSFGDEKVQGYEVGLKSRLLDRSLLVNLAFYDYYYKGLQVGGISPSDDGVPSIRTVNAGRARTYGVDLDATYYPPSVEGLSLNASVSWNHARYTLLNNIACFTNQTIAMGCVNFPNPLRLDPATGLPRFTAQELSGTQMVRAPEWSGNFGFTYEMPVGSGMRLQFANNNQFSSDYPTFPAINVPNNSHIQKGFIKVDANVALKGEEDRWEVALIGRNIFRKQTASTCYANNGAGQNFLGGDNSGGTTMSAAGLPETGCYSDSGRSIWVRLTFRPFG